MALHPGIIAEDRRLGGVPRYYFDFGRRLMRIHEEIRRSVTFVACRRGEDYYVAGTAFFVAVKNSFGGFSFSAIYAVTARHVIEGIDSELGDPGIYLHMNTRDSGVKHVRSSLSDWYFHPSDDAIDVAVMPIQFDGVDHLASPLDFFLTDKKMQEERIWLGENLFTVTQFFDRRSNRVIPMVRAGNISVMPETRVTTNWTPGEIEAYLIESKSIGGFSGSPVFVYLPVRTSQTCGEYPESPTDLYYLLGLLHGHWSLDIFPQDRIKFEEEHIKGVSAGIGVVVPAKKILEVLNQPSLNRLRREMETEMKARLALEYPGAIPD